MSCADCPLGYLIHEQTLCDPTITIDVDQGVANFEDMPFMVTITSTVGSSGKHYVLAARVMNTDGSYYTGQLFSDVFELTGANGTRAKFQQQGNTLWGDDGMACLGFSCVKGCADAPNITTTDGYYDTCINSCPGVSVDPNSSHDPTAALVEPSACPNSVSSKATTTTTMSRSSTRPVTAAARTGVAVPMNPYNAMLSAAFPPLLKAGLLG
ncbi:hypothetical protein EK21DRAFT_88777 [Setomelanomma holmii]|uniref:Uncharacterized protein n=1 Tax=Setomelanomma holmii TaxID=210430 RepID=A0A9P4LNG6_9PLEO|nr:hypothetical protein EK21DRAFT_88777 [Setomelanomma holmii]